MDMLGAGVGGAALAILPFVAGVHFGRRREKKRNIQRRSVRGASQQVCAATPGFRA